MVRNKDLVALRGVSAMYIDLEELEKKVTRGPCQEAFNHTRRMGKKQVLNHDRAYQNGTSARGREMQVTQSCWRGPEGT